MRRLLILALGGLFFAPVFSWSYSPQEYRASFAQDWAKAEQMAVELENRLMEKLKSPVLARLGTAVVFPELSRYSYIRDVAETSALEFSYVLGQGADFSIGKLQMKPSFAELMEEWALNDPDLSFPRVANTSPQGVDQRKQRLVRLKNDDDQSEYLAVFLLGMKKKYPGLQDGSLDQLKLFAAAYNVGPNKPLETLQAQDKSCTFPFGSHYESEQFSYVQIAQFFYSIQLGRSRHLTAQQEARVRLAWKASLSDEVCEKLNHLLGEVQPGYQPPEIELQELEKEAICAKVVSRIFWSIWGREDDLATARGVSGNAWDMARNVRLFKGRVFPAGSTEALKPGDILGLHYSKSIYNEVPKPVDYTHVALVLAVTPQDGPLIVHCWRPPAECLPQGTPKPWPVRLEFLSDLQDSFPGLFTLKEIIRPRE